MSRKPKGFTAFSELLRRLVVIPKQVVDDRIAQQKAARKNRQSK